MTTSLTRPVARETATVLRPGRGARPIIVTLLPGDLLEFREKGRRRRYLLPVAAAMWTAIKAEVAAERRAKAEERKLKKEQRRRR